MTAVRIRPPAVAGLFYPDHADALASTVRDLLAGAPASAGPRPRALIVPHAGYIYSGAAAAAAYARLRSWRDDIEKVLVLGPPHRVPVRGVALSGASAFATPLGALSLAVDDRDRLLAAPDVSIDDAAHAPEHSIEVQLPFLKAVLGAVELLPMLVGESAPARVAQLLAPYWDEDGALIVISTDLSHFLDYNAARLRDSETDASIMGLDAARIGPEQACGCRALNGLLYLAAQRKSGIERLALCNSGDTAGDQRRVVGYAAYALH